MGPEDLLLIACNEFRGIEAIVLLNERRNDCGQAEEQNRLIDHTELNSILKLVMSCQFSVRRCVNGFLTFPCSWSRSETEAEGDRRRPTGGQDHLMSAIDAIIRPAAG